MMEINIHEFKRYIDLLCLLEEGDQINFADGKIVRRMDNRAWESVFVYDDEETLEDLEDLEEEV
ncbi:hypothetical protein [Nostoc sp. 2RC]|uniref:hypothetical protein n=1 Tax=Nostoc sp. 2RC TaxID=2485484 RepID=UPI0016236760|nr:hypothetical protein [Nostoc sp. 2RC]MBC1235925.1 hypothetical protein [Nostoc sp. 2RC]